MATISPRNLHGCLLDWAVRYSQEMLEVMGERRIPVRSEHEQVVERLKKANVLSLTPEQIINIVISYRITVFERSNRWYAMSSREMPDWIMDHDSGIIQVKISKKDIVQGDNYPDAVKRCFVRMVLGDNIGMLDPDY